MTDTRLRVGIDVDDVCAAFIRAHQKVCRELFGKPEVGTIPVDWAFTNYNLTKEEHTQIWDAIAKRYNFWQSLLPCPDTGDLTAFAVTGILPFFITSRVPTVGKPIELQTAVWLEQYYGFTHPTVIVAHSKGPLAKALNLDYFIDDRDKNVLEVADAHPTCKVFIKDSGHNKDFNDPRITRVANLNDFLNRLPVSR
jgi:hypothetical protein